MNAKSRILAVVSAALLLGVSLVPASALDLNVGGINISGGSSGNGGTGTAIHAGAGGASVGVTLGGGSTLASATVGTGGTGLNVNIGSGAGPLLTTSSANGTTTANVNLGLGGLGGTVNDAVNGITDPVGDLLDEASIPIPGDDGDGNGAPGDGGVTPDVTPTQLASAFGGLSASEQDFLLNRCRSVLIDPARFDPSLTELCRILARMQMFGTN